MKAGAGFPNFRPDLPDFRSDLYDFRTVLPDFRAIIFDFRVFALLSCVLPDFVRIRPIFVYYTRLLCNFT